LERGLSRITAAAWIHKEEDVRGAIASVVGKEVETPPRNNTFESKGFRGSDIRLTASDLEVIRTFEQRDELAFKVAADLGLIQLLPEDEKQYLFEKTASRLMFKL
jgi:RNA binding exosome subunit